MKELFMVDPTLVGVLVALVLFVIFVIIYKSKQNSSTTYYNYDETYEDIAEIEEAEKIDKTTEKPEDEKSEEEIEFDIKPVLVVCLIVMYNINKRLDVLGVLWSLVFTVLVSVMISIFVPKEILRRFFPKKPKNNDD